MTPEDRTPSRSLSLPALVALGAAVAAGVGWWGARVDAQSTDPAAARPAASPARTPATAALRTSFNDVLEPTMRGVVNVRATRRARRGGQQEESPGAPFRWFLPGPDGDDERQPWPDPESQGSGVIVRSDGIILTNNHVVADSTAVDVTLPDGRELRAQVVGTDPPTDIAVLRIETPARALDVLPLGRSSDLRVGDLVFAIGNPFGVGQTATMGIVSGTGRSRLGLIGPGSYEDFIQTDAPINPGNSGGALVDSNGQLVGINTGIYTRTGGNMGIGFAVPVDMASRVMTQILEEGRVTRAYLGVGIAEVTTDVARQMGLENAEGALVQRVEPDTPAARAGLRAGDVLTSLDGKRVTSDVQLRMDISTRKPGSRVKLGVLRDERPLTIEATLAELDAAPRVVESGREEDVREGTLRGVAVRALDGEVREQLEAPTDVRGVVVTRLAPGSPAALSGLEPGDVILAMNRRDVASEASFRKAVEELGEETALMRVWRKGTDMVVIVRE